MERTRPDALASVRCLAADRPRRPANPPSPARSRSCADMPSPSSFTAYDDSVAAVIARVEKRGTVSSPSDPASRRPATRLAVQAEALDLPLSIAGATARLLRTGSTSPTRRRLGAVQISVCRKRRPAPARQRRQGRPPAVAVGERTETLSQQADFSLQFTAPR